MIEEKMIPLYRELFEKYKKATMISFGSPDQYQFHQNELAKSLAEFILLPFYEWESEEYKKKADADIEKIKMFNDGHCK